MLNYYDIFLSNDINSQCFVTETDYVQSGFQKNNNIPDSNKILNYIDNYESKLKVFNTGNRDMSAIRPTPSWRPRGPLARALIDKMYNDEYLDNIDPDQWYIIDSTFDLEELSSMWTPLTHDGATKRWVEGAKTTASNLPLQIYHSIMRAILGVFMTQTDVNGWLNRGSMFVLSTEQFRTLLNRALTPNNSAFNGSHWSRGRLLDIGAGDGASTARLEPLFEEVFVTEMSGPMRNRLAERGYKILHTTTWPAYGPFDVISCLNVLDRCANPMSLLKDIRNSLSPGGVAVIALVLPFKPYVETGTPDNQPFERLDIGGITFEVQALSLAKILKSIGFTVKAWSRVPYLCHGDINQAFYFLDDVIMIASRNEDFDDNKLIDIN